MKASLITLVLVLITSLNYGQQFTQTIRGVIIDSDSKLSIPGVNIILLDSSRTGTTSDVNGKFRLENIAIGRVTLQFSFIGYKTKIISNLIVNSSQQVVVNVELEEDAIEMAAFTVKAMQNKGEPVNDMAIISARSISLEETKRFSGGMDDPARMVTSYAGVTASNGSSDIIVRGNSPKYMEWRLDGVKISSPYHMDDQNASFGALTALNKNLLGTSDFYTGAFSPEYGNVLSNVMNMRLRVGNNEKFEATFGLGLLGTDLTVEGPFKKGYGGSYLINYRYSTVGLLKELGLLEGVEGVVNYQDATFKIVLPTKKMGTFSIFGLGGISAFSFTNVSPDGISTPGLETNASIVKDYDKTANLSNLAVVNTKTLSSASYLRTSLSYSANGFDDDLYAKNDSMNNRLHTFKSSVRNSAYQAALTYYYKINPRNKIQIGTRYTYNSSDYDQSTVVNNSGNLVNVTDFDNSFSSLNNFISWKYNLNDKITFVSGFHNMNIFLNNNSTLEPRLAVDWKLNNTNSIHAGYGKHSRTESVHNYFTKVLLPDGSFIEPNKNLGLLKADHYVLGYEKRFGNNLVAKLEVYYQHLYNLPVENIDTSYYATINEGLDYRYVPLVNKGLGKNYGVEFTLERFFDNNYYFVFNASLYESKYKTLEGVWRNTMYNGNYLVNFLFGKEYKLGSKKNKILAINTKAFFGGGQRYIPLLRGTDGNVAVNPANNQYWDYEKAYDNELVHVYNVNLSVSYKINTPKLTHEIFLDLMNIVNSNAKLSEYYDESEPDKIGYTKQAPFLPNLMYRLYF